MGGFRARAEPACGEDDQSISEREDQNESERRTGEVAHQNGSTTKGGGGINDASQKARMAGRGTQLCPSPTRLPGTPVVTITD